MKRVSSERFEAHAPMRLVVPNDRSPKWATVHPDAARRDVTSENIRSSLSRELDARFMLAEKVAREIEGGQAAILRPQRRRALVAAALDMGLRRFDAYLIIAIVQESARRGEVVTLSSLAGGSHRGDTREERRLRARLSMLPTAREKRGQGIELLVFASVLLGVLMLAIWIVLIGP